jgi:alcohol dehydrogenase
VAGGGWVLGHLIDGTQAEYVRVPFADLSLHPIPDAVTDQAALMLADIVPTAYEVGVLNGHVSPGDTVAVVGAGPIGLAAIMTAKFFSPSQVIAIELAASRLEAAKLFGADHTLRSNEDPVTAVMSLTDGRGADVVIEAVGVPDTFELCTQLVTAGGHVANVGVHGRPATLHLENLWIKNVTMTTGLVDTYSTPTLLAMLGSGQLQTSEFITHHFTLDEMAEAYQVFGDPTASGALKVALVRS